MTVSKQLDDFTALIRRGNYLILDTETTGLDRGEIVQIAIIDDLGTTLLNSLVKPFSPIPYEASRIHGITDQHVISAPEWAVLWPAVMTLLNGKDVVVYNASYDLRMLYQSSGAWQIPTDWAEIACWHDAMETFAEVYGEWNSYHGSYRWQRLETAARHYNLPVVNAHSALGDCLMTLGVVKAMAGVGQQAGK